MGTVGRRVLMWILWNYTNVGYMPDCALHLSTSKQAVLCIKALLKAECQLSTWTQALRYRRSMPSSVTDQKKIILSRITRSMSFPFTTSTILMMQTPATASSYMYEMDDTEHPEDSLFIRQVTDAETKLTST
ncbi:hypothetical protein HPG69_010894 [Diceros bicornis minor]|uniref:Uncharacterized protein n=1 Tax=Diceros bicornis minor TaxID=77932 RepID=A0A7J7EGI6_DICBM|nr:hypothetical protein HPG69_010894 [Diceros bicornis minor]